MEIQVITEHKIAAEYVQYNGLKIEISCMGEDFTVLNLARERMYRSIPGHRHGSGDWELHLITGGTGQIELAGRTYDVENGDWFLAGPHVEHLQISYREDPVQEETVYFHRRENQKDEGESYLLPAFCYCRGESERMEEILRMIFREMKEQRFGYTSYVRLLLEQLVLEVSRQSNGVDGGVGRKNRRDEKNEIQECFAVADPGRMQDYMVEKAFLYEYADLTLKSLAEQVGLSERQLQRHLRERYSSTFVAMRRRARLEAAKMLLRHTDLPISRISEEVGYSTAEHFTVFFSEETGISPLKFRKKRG